MLSDPLYDFSMLEQTKNKLLADLINVEKKIIETQDKIDEISSLTENYPAIVVADALKRFKAHSSQSDHSKIYLIDKNNKESIVYTGGYCSPNNKLNEKLKISEQELASFHKLGFKLKYQLTYHCA